MGAKLHVTPIATHVIWDPLGKTPVLKMTTAIACPKCGCITPVLPKSIVEASNAEKKKV